MGIYLEIRGNCIYPKDSNLFPTPQHLLRTLTPLMRNPVYELFTLPSQSPDYPSIYIRRTDGSSATFQELSQVFYELSRAYDKQQEEIGGKYEIDHPSPLPISPTFSDKEPNSGIASNG